MIVDEKLLKNDEKVVLRLRDIYRSYGFSPFKMNKFEEYDLYSQNKDFLVSDGVITFNDTNGKLMALKPDVTISIVKNFKKSSSGVSRVYYNENVYRISDKTHSYKEIMQTGLEILGDLSDYNLFEAAELAALSLASISEDYILRVSNLGVLSALLFDMPTEVKNELLFCIGNKNSHGVKEICEKTDITEENVALLEFLCSASGNPEEIINAVKGMTQNDELLSAISVLENIVMCLYENYGDKIIVDFSLIGDINYYNGIVFQGYVKGIPSSVLSGGEYGKLMLKMGHKCGAIGFAVYLDLLERMKPALSYDVDVVLLYNKNDDLRKVYEKVSEIKKSGKSVSVQTNVPKDIVYCELVDMRGE